MVKKILIALLVIITLVPAAGIGWLWYQSPGVPDPIVNVKGEPVPGSISVIEKLTVGGVEQAVIIRGHSRKNPVLLFLHGGPGSPELAFYKAANTDIEKHVTVVHWEQRGAGMSYDAGFPEGPGKINRYVDDAIELAEILKKRFGQDKIYLLGHSWGSLLGVLVVQKRPDLFHAYIGVGQVANLAESEKVAWEWAMARAKEDNNTKAIADLTAAGPGPYSTADIEKKGIEISWIMEYGGGMIHDTEDMYEKIFSSLLFAREYSLRDKFNFLRGSRESLYQLWDEILAVNLFTRAPKLQVPVYILQGEFDYQVSTPVTKRYFQVLQAPVKKYFAFEKSAHGTIFEEPEKFYRILTEEILKGK